MAALRFNAGKPKVSYMLQFPRVLEAMARIMEFGAAKYEDGNWKKGGKEDQEYLDSAMRHILQRLEGKVFDDDSGCAHIGHAIWNLCAWLQLNHPDEICDKAVFDERCKFWMEKRMMEKKDGA
ncbi:MAG: hypothetical protein AMXMBFR16_10460 [Candidatus Uhrbacteria bacterium]